MEPFRPFVDECVYRNRNRTFNWDYRKELISIPYGSCLYGNVEMNIASVIEKFTYDAMETMMIPRGMLDEIGFVKE